MEELLGLLEEVRPDIDFTVAENLMDDGTLDSFAIISIVTEINETYDIEIGVLDLEPQNFNSAQAILNLIVSHQEK